MLGIATGKTGRPFVVVVAIALLAAAALALAPAMAHAQATTATGYVRCESNGKVCETVVTRNAGGRYVEEILVSTNYPSDNARIFRILFDGDPRWTIELFPPHNNQAAVAPEYNVDPGRCIQGGIEDFGRTPCWYAP